MVVTIVLESWPGSWLWLWMSYPDEVWSPASEDQAEKAAAKEEERVILREAALEDRSRDLVLSLGYLP